MYYFWITERQAEGRRPEMDERIREKPKKSLKYVKNEKCTLKDLEYGEKTENLGK